MLDPTTRLMSASTHRAELHRTAPRARRERPVRTPRRAWFEGLRRRPVAPVAPPRRLAGQPG